MKKPADKIKRVGLIGNSDKASFRTVVRRAARLVTRSGRTVMSDAHTGQLAGLDCRTFPGIAALAEAVDLLLVFGGDGTLLRVARDTAGSPTPILGINIGGLGFLTAVPSAELARALTHVWRGEFSFQQRALISAAVRIGDRQLRLNALNDCVITRGGIPRLIELEVSVNRQPLTRYRCDGLIISSPTGSTAYSLAAGGAIVAPDAEVFALTPICPHTLSNRSIIVRLDSVVQVRVISPRPATILSVDGQFIGELDQGGIITIRRSPRTDRMMLLAGASFYQTLRQKLHWRGAHV